METLEEYFEQYYNKDYVKLANTIRQIALDYAKICLYQSLQGKEVNEKAPEYIYILQLLADAIEQMKEQQTIEG